MKSLEQNLSEIYAKAERLKKKKEKKLKAIKSASVISVVSLSTALLIFAGLSAALKMKRHETISVDTTDDGMTVTSEEIPVSQLLITESSSQSGTFPGSSFSYWNELEITGKLERTLLNVRLNSENASRYLVLNPFRREGQPLTEEGGFLSEYRYEGKTYAEYEEELRLLSERHTRLLRLRKEGEILKYGKEILSTDGVPSDDIKIHEGYRGIIWTPEYYEDTVSYYNYFDQNFLNDFIVDGAFLAEKVENEIKLISDELEEIQEKENKYFDAYYSQHDQNDVAIFRDAGIVSGEIDGRLYIIVTYEAFSHLADVVDCNGLTFSFLPQKYYPDVLTGLTH